MLTKAYVKLNIQGASLIFKLSFLISIIGCFAMPFAKLAMEITLDASGQTIELNSFELALHLEPGFSLGSLLSSAVKVPGI